MSQRLLCVLVLGLSGGCSGPERSARVTTSPAAPAIEVVAELDRAPGNLSTGVDGRILVTLHQFYAPAEQLGFLERNEWAWQTTDAVDSALGVFLAADGTAWLLDNGLRSGRPPQLVAYKGGAGRATAPATSPSATSPTMRSASSIAAARIACSSPIPG